MELATKYFEQNFASNIGAQARGYLSDRAIAPSTSVEFRLRLGRSNIVLALVRDYAIGYISNHIMRQLDVALAAHGYVVLAHRLDESIRPLADLWRMVSPCLVVGMGGLTLPDNMDVIDDANNVSTPPDRTIFVWRGVLL